LKIFLVYDSYLVGVATPRVAISLLKLKKKSFFCGSLHKKTLLLTGGALDFKEKVQNLWQF